MKRVKANKGPSIKNKPRMPCQLLTVAICYSLSWIALAMMVAPPALSQERGGVLVPLARLSVAGQISGKGGGVAQDISGMACIPTAGLETLCLLIDDESTSAQFVSLNGSVLQPGAVLPLIGRDAPGNAVGTPPSISCAGAKKFADLDGEGVAYENRQFYVVGSHGCSRHSNSFRLSSFILARVSMAGTGESVKSIELTYRLSDVLTAALQVGDRFGKRLNTASNGLNIEGIALSGGKLWVGLRAPVDNGKAYLIGAPIDELFALGNSKWKGEPDVRVLPLGAERGIRDLASLSAGRLLILSGAAQNQDIDYRLHLMDLNTSAPPLLIGTIENVPNGKAEGVTVMRESLDTLDCIVMFDSVKNGGGLLYRVKLP
ncbi:MAG: DUF3616 domain-containing protein [Betaproteobacteria bacterium]